MAGRWHVQGLWQRTAGWTQNGTVRPKLIITCGVSGAIQFVAGMDHSDQIIAINKDEKASIFKVAHYGLVGDLYEVIPQFIEKIKESQGA